MNIVADLLQMQDLSYRDFQSLLIPSISKDSIIGVRVPHLRKYARSFTDKQKYAFFASLPHTYYEENMLHAILLSSEKDKGKVMELTEVFLPHIDNWSVCDTFFPCALSWDSQELFRFIQNWVYSDHEYTCRFAINLLMRCFLNETFTAQSMALVASLKREEYYIEMMVAWYFATALAKQYDSAIVYLEEHKLSPSIHRKTIQKAIESYRIPESTKCYLRTLR